MGIRQAGKKELPILTELALRLWPDHEPCEMEVNLAEIIEDPGAAFFLAFNGEAAVGFAQCQLRHDYVEGTGSSPVGYLEGIYVTADYRGRGIAKMLLAACEGWAKSKGCREFASDCELTNTESLKFHLKMDFTEANRIICFTKRI